MKKLSLDQLKDKVTVINENEVKQSIAGGGEGSPAWWAGYYAGKAYRWLSDQIDELLED